MSLTLSHRQLVPEVMDDPTLDATSHHAALRGLARINAVTRADAMIWPAIRATVRRAGRPMRLLDVACGGGDVTLALQRRARAERLPLTVHGCDISATALHFARRRAAAESLPVAFHALDVLAEGLPRGYDILTASLFLHHLSRQEAVAVLRSMGEVGKSIVISDLRRCRLGLLAAAVAVRCLSCSPVVHVDAPRSVRGAFTVPELRDLADEAGLGDATVRRRFPFRMLLTWNRL